MTNARKWRVAAVAVAATNFNSHAKVKTSKWYFVAGRRRGKHWVSAAAVDDADDDDEKDENVDNHRGAAPSDIAPSKERLSRSRAGRCNRSGAKNGQINSS